jgi:hypothetical protein
VNKEKDKEKLVPFRYRRIGETQSLSELTSNPLGLPRSLSAEANLLKLPLFTLARNSSTLLAIECCGVTRRQGKKQEFSFTVARSTATTFPGTLARSVHMAFLSMVREQGFPFENPLTWTWRDLCRRMGICPGGKTEAELKKAILATKALTIFSNYGLYSKREGKLLRTTTAAINLYDKVIFEQEKLSTNDQADMNGVWFADWYLDNLNALYSAPINYDLWLVLDAKSHVASRLYEFLLIKFYKREQALTFNYPTLVQFLPLKPRSKLALAHQQLDKAFDLLIHADILRKVIWGKPKNPKDLAKLCLHRGERLSSDSVVTLPGLDEEDEAEVIEVREIHITPEELVAQFYQLWDHTKPSIKPAESHQAKELIDKYGPDMAKALIPKVVQRMKKKWPEAKTFGATSRYVEEVAAEYDRQEKAAEAKCKAAERDREERQKHQEQREAEKQFQATWQPVWAAAPQSERDEIREKVKAKNAFYREGKLAVFFELDCLREFSRRREPQAQGSDQAGL